MHNDDDIPLDVVLHAQAGDSDAQNNLLRYYEPRLYTMARSLHQNSAITEVLVQRGRMSLIDALRKFQPGRASFWSYVYRNIKGTMIDGLAKELGLSDDARKAYPKVMAAYRRIEQQALQAPTSDQIATECSLTLGLVDQILRVVFRPVRSYEEMVERGWERQLEHDSPLSPYTTTPETFVDFYEEANQHRAQIQTDCVRCLGEEEARRFLVAAILREGNGGYDYSWEEIAACLSGDRSPPAPDWEVTIEAEFACWTCLPPSWPAVQELFRRWNAAPTAAALRQRFSQARRALERGTRIAESMARYWQQQEQ